MTPIVQSLLYAASLREAAPILTYWVLKLQFDDPVISYFSTSRATNDGGIITSTASGFLKINAEGVVTNSKKLIFSNNSNINNYDVLSDNSIIYTGNLEGAGGSVLLVAGMLDGTTSMTPQWTKTWGSASAGKFSSGYSLVKNTADNTYSVVGYGNFTSSIQTAVNIRLTSTGAFSAARYYNYASNNTYGWGVTTDSVGNNYIITSDHVVKISTTSAVLWQRTIQNPAPSDSYPQPVVYQDRVYFYGNGGTIHCLNSDGSLYANAYIDVTDVAIQFKYIAIDSTGVYVSAKDFFTTDIYVFKLTHNLSAVSYCRKITNLQTFTDNYEPTIVVKDNVLYITSDTSTNSLVIIKYPADGSLLGAYGPMTVTAESSNYFTANAPTTTPIITQTTPSSLFANATNPTLGTPANVIADKGTI